MLGMTGNAVQPKFLLLCEEKVAASGSMYEAFVTPLPPLDDGRGDIKIFLVKKCALSFGEWWVVLYADGQSLPTQKNLPPPHRCAEATEV